MRGFDFAVLVHEILIDSRNEWTIENIADRLGVTYEVLYARLGTNMRVAFSADEIRELIRQMPDPRLLYYLLDGTPFIAVDRLQPDFQNEQNLVLKMMSAVAEVGDIAKQMGVALGDNKIDHQDRSRLLNEVVEAEHALANLRAGLVHHL